MLKYYLIFIGVMSLITLILYGADKAKAKKHAWRIKEAVLLLFGLFGGALGGLIGMEVFRHKTKHWYFWAVNILGLAIHAALALLIFFKLK
ncbi:MAG: DUF1294 domain-containing protein [Oscillospiraceae bacterium]|nr:DUF1294 domain-containing protein [Oscillospiraceae bacterium]